MKNKYTINPLLIPSWTNPPTKPKLPNNEVHVWLFDLDNQVCSLHGLWKILTQKEVEQCQRFRCRAIQKRFIYSRSFLRCVLGKYLEIDAQKICIQNTKYGKPYMRPVGENTIVQFNLSHSGNLIIYCFTSGHVIGIDVENIHPIEEMDTIITHFFSSEENRFIYDLHPRQRLDGFYYCWTRKEAYMKANGKGFSLPLNSFTVPIYTDNLSHQNNFHNTKEDKRQWQFMSFLPVPGYFAAISTYFEKAPVYKFWNVQLVT